jgi:sigma-54 dependent transcriptional regulator, acetoin dehydrogenase operon transcriptional activator AcoR
MHAAAPVLKELSHQFEGFEVGALLADRSATLVAGCFGTTALAGDAERVGVVPGVRFSEDMSGTNAIATPFETRTGLFVRQDEHFLASMRHYFCYGVPILHPVTQRVEAVIDVMTSASTNPALMKSVMDRAARDIRQQLIETYDVNVMAVFAAFNTLRRNATDAVVMISDDIVLNNRHSVDILAPEDYVTLRNVTLERPGFSGTIDLSLRSGLRVSVKITDMGDPPATVFQLRRCGQPSRIIPRGALTTKLTSELDRDIAAARADSGHVFVEGEPGSGRSWVAQQIVQTADAAHLDGCDLIKFGDAAWLASLDATQAAGREFLVVDNVDVLAKSVVTYLARFLRSGHGQRVVLTSTPLADSPVDLGYLQSLCTSTVQIPALGERMRELDTLVVAIIRDVLEAPNVRVTLSAMEALSTYRWPGNITELVRVLSEAVAKRSAGDITVNDLPERFRASKRERTLSTLQRAERDAIEAALKSCSGNKVHAAAELGISRSTLYARIREYGLP